MITDQELNEAIDTLIEIANESVDWKTLIERCESKDKVLEVRIVDAGDAGFFIENNRLKRVPQTGNPTTTATIDKATFEALVVSDNPIETLNLAYWTWGTLRLSGSNWFRESKILMKIFEELVRIVKS